jgi:hypothetical protein
MLFLFHRFSSPWWWRRWVPPKLRFLQEPHGVTYQKTVFFWFKLFVRSGRRGLWTQKASSGRLWYGEVFNLEVYCRGSSYLVLFIASPRLASTRLFRSLLFMYVRVPDVYFTSQRPLYVAPRDLRTRGSTEGPIRTRAPPEVILLTFHGDVNGTRNRRWRKYVHIRDGAWCCNLTAHRQGNNGLIYS